MAEQLNISINLNGTEQVVTSIGQVKKALKEAEFQALALEEQFGAGSPQVVALRKNIEALRDKIGDAADATKSFAEGGLFTTAAKSLAGVAGGFSAVQGAIGLLGVESKELEKQLLKVQSALALSQGLGQVIQSKDVFINLANAIKTQVVTAFNTLKGAISASGLLLLSVAIGLLISNFDKVKKAVLDLVPVFADIGEFIGNLVNKVTDFVGITSEAGRATAKLIADNNKAIKESERFLELNGDKYDEYTQRKIKANLEFKKKQNEFSEDEKLTEAQKIEYIKQAREKANREILKADQDRYAKSEEDNKAAFEKQKKIDDDRKKRKEEEDKAEKERIEKQNQAQANALKLRLEAIDNTNKAAEEQAKADEDEIAKLYAQEEKKQGVIIESNNKQILEQNKFNNAIISAEQQLQDAKFAAASAGINALGSLVGQNEKLANALFILDKALAIGKIVVDTQREIAGYAASNSVFGPAGIALTAKMALGAKIRAAAGIATIAATTIAKFKGGASASNFGGGGSINTSGVPIVPQQNQAQLTQLNQASINALGNQAVKAYVVESDVTSSQQRIAAIQQRARFE